MSQNQNIFDFDVDVFEQLEPQKSPVPEPQSPPENTIIVPKKQQQPELISQTKQKSKKITNRFGLTDQQKININKRLPKGFVLLKKNDLAQNNGPFKGEIQYVPIKKDPKIASQQLLQKFPISVFGTANPKKQTEKRVEKPGLRLSSGQLPEGKSKQTQKVKGVLQKFRKHPKYPILAQQLNKLGFMQGFSEIQSEIKKNIHTIDSFKDRCLYILNQAKLATFAETTIDVINELMDEFMFQIQQAKKLEFENNLIVIQKNIDKITRQITDIKESGNWYLRKKKRAEKNFDEKQVMYIADLVRQLPPAYLVGVWEIIEEKPFLESQQKQLEINFSQLKTKKIRQIQSYVKRKHNTYFTSRQRKKQKIDRKLKIQEQKMQDQMKDEEKQQQMDIETNKKFIPQTFKIQNQFENFLSAENLDLKQERPSQNGNQFDLDLQDIGGGQTVALKQKDQMDQFLQLDELFLSNEKEQIKPQQDSKVPPTPRFNAVPAVYLRDQPNQLEQKAQRQQQERQMQEQKQVQQFQMEEPDLRIPQPIEGDSSDSSFITDDEDSDY